MKPRFFLRHVFFFLAASLFLAGCLFKPVTDSTRHFVLSQMASNGPPMDSLRHLSIGVGPVSMPSQLLGDSLGVYNGANEVEYFKNAVWAERLDHGLERTLAADLSCLLSSDAIYLDDWGREQVMARVFVNVQQFEVDTRGTGTLIAQWRMTVPGQDLPFKRGLARLSRPGAPPNQTPEVIASTLSDLVADLSRELAQVINESGEKLARTDRAGPNSELKTQ